MKKMLTNLLKPLPIIFLSLFFMSCFEDNDDNAVTASSISDFVWKGMNAAYLYKSNVPDLANDRFENTNDYAAYLNAFESPESCFESLIYARQTVDRYSWIVNDYIALEQQFSGTTKSNGMAYGLVRLSATDQNVYGYVRYVLPNTSAESASVERGMLFCGVDGTQLTVNNYKALLAADNYTINLGTYNDNGTEDESDDNIVPNNESIVLPKSIYTANPVYQTELLEVENESVGYLVYNGFVSEFESQLNAAFASFAAANVQHLVVDLRYNPGGSVETATVLGSLITGQFTDELFVRLEYNEDVQASVNDLETLNYRFTTSLDNGSGLNSLGMQTVYFITTKNSASASELVINSLKPYLGDSELLVFGKATEGKSQASVTLYDSPTYGRTGANPNHTYAMQPLVAITKNSLEVSVPSDGLTPFFEIDENLNNLGQLGDPNEPLLAAVLDHIAGSNFAPINSFLSQSILIDSDQSLLPFKEGLHFRQRNKLQ